MSEKHLSILQKTFFTPFEYQLLKNLEMCYNEKDKYKGEIKMTRRNNTYSAPPTLDRIIVSNELDILNKLRESQEDKQNNRTVTSSIGWSNLQVMDKQV